MVSVRPIRIAANRALCHVLGFELEYSEWFFLYSLCSLATSYRKLILRKPAPAEALVRAYTLIHSIVGAGRAKGKHSRWNSDKRVPENLFPIDLIDGFRSDFRDARNVTKPSAVIRALTP
jgi:hypothetical protein